MAKRTRRVLAIKDIAWDKDLYPRSNPNWQISLTYKNAMKSGDKFPPIKVALFRRKYILVDGKHRIEAYKAIKQKHVDAEILFGLNKKQIFVEAIKANIAHGAQLGVNDKAQVIIRLKDIGYDIPKISNIMSMPVKEITNFSLRKITNTFNGREIPLKPALKHLSGMEVDDNIPSIQESYGPSSQFSLITELNSLIANRLIDIRDSKNLVALKRLYKLLGRYKSVTKA